MERINFNKEEHKANFQRFAASPKNNKFAVGEDGRTVSGYVAVWDVLSGDRGGYLALFPKDSAVLPTYPITVQWNHNDDYVLATEDNASAVITIDEYGVLVTAKLEDTYIDNYVLTKIKSGVIKGMSVGMYSLVTHREQREVTSADADGNPELIPYIGKTVSIEVYDKWVLDEATITGRPAFPQTDIGIAAPPNFSKKEEGVKGAELEEVNKYLTEIANLTLD